MKKNIRKQEKGNEQLRSKDTALRWDMRDRGKMKDGEGGSR